MSELQEIALFPIPGMVAFPETKVPLHVFEPRYRQLVKESVQAGRRIGVAHTKRTISEAPEGQKREEILSSNQGYYEPYSVFSAGLAEIKEVTADGRFLVEVKMDGRYRWVDAVQELPYKVGLCEALDDQEDDAKNKESNGFVRKQADQFLLDVAEQHGVKPLRSLVDDESWREQSDYHYSYRIFQFMRLDATLAQRVLEMNGPSERLHFLKDIMEKTPKAW